MWRNEIESLIKVKNVWNKRKKIKNEGNKFLARLLGGIKKTYISFWDPAGSSIGKFVSQSVCGKKKHVAVFLKQNLEFLVKQLH